MKIVRIITIILCFLWVLISFVLTIPFGILSFLIFFWFGRKLFKNTLLLLLSLFLSFGLLPLGFLYSCLKVITKTKSITEFSEYIYKVAISDDQKGNVVLSPLFNDTLITKDGYKYGNPDKTISEVTGVNVLDNTLTGLGYRFNLLLSMFGRDHSVRTTQKNSSLNTTPN